ncbi:AraC-like DNA-binding protein [Caulobacter ginsengisoli]|uniref:AraC-like DNA-binding protein n=1 Tax=Caulobacter ginsengisoli TaxID=400775 RepID=A0ABU0IX74_9CAUL|nr:AraC family transcriptional regulator [Caulobacter ginsengisoli]MDQ0465946.1 AraC-like DNA-binding protein [Caulobacter ginsengisoli]
MGEAHAYRRIKVGVETLPPDPSLPRHRHDAPYANLVLAGGFIEASFAGRFTVAPGQVLLHAAFDCHANWAEGRRDVQILRLPWFDDGLEGRFEVADPDALARLAERDPREARAVLAASLKPVAAGEGHWTDHLAADLTDDPAGRLRTWAADHALAPETVARGFHRAFGASPRLFRLEARARRAWQAVRAGRGSLTRIAHEQGFADLAHMSRSIRALTGHSPAAWRVNSVQVAAASGG